MIDVTIPIEPNMTIYPGDLAVSVDPVLRIAKGDPADVSRYCLGSHTGTHLDPPSHFIPGGLVIDQLPLETLVGAARVASVEHVSGAIGATDLAAANVPAGTTRLLLKTRNSALWADPDQPFDENYVYLGEDGARWVIDNGIRLVGIDYLSIEGYRAQGHPVHRLLLGSGVLILEGLDLREVAPGEYRLVCLPLKVRGGDGGPARVVLM